MDGAIEVKEKVEGKKGKVTYQMPVFKKVPVKAETEEEAKKLDATLQEYLSAYFKLQADRIAEHHTVETVASEFKLAESRSKEPVSVMSEDPLATSPEDDGSDLPF
jgi:hypothetical protein